MKKNIQILMVILMVTTFIQFNRFDSSINQVNSIVQEKIILDSFDSFEYELNSEYIVSQNYGQGINFSYCNEMAPYPSVDAYRFLLPNKNNCTDFWIHVGIDYSYSKISDLGSLGFYLRSNYTEDGDLSDNPIGYIELWDGFESSYGRYHVVGYPNNAQDSQAAAIGSMGARGIVNFYAKRTENNLTLAIKDWSTGEILLSYSWLSGVSRPLNAIAIEFHSGESSVIDYDAYAIIGELVIETIEIKETNTEQVIVDSYMDFNYELNSEYIDSINYGSGVNFSYFAAAPDYPHVDAYRFLLPENKNCTDFQIETYVNYSYTTESDIGSFGFYLRSNYTENWNLADNPIGYIELWDGFESSYGRYHVVGYPENTPSSIVAAIGSMSINGSVLFYAKRTENNLTLAIKNWPSGEILLSYSWLSGVSRPLNAIAIEFHSGKSSNIKISTCEFYGNLTIENIEVNKTISEYVLYGFTNFNYELDSKYIESVNNGNSIFFSYYGEPAPYPSVDAFRFLLPNQANCTNFQIELIVDYLYSSYSEVGSLGFYLRSNYTENGNLYDNPIGYIELWDGFDSSYGRYHIVGYPNNAQDSYTAATGSMGASGKVSFYAERTENNLTLAIKNWPSNEVLFSYSWLSGVNRTLNALAIEFHSGLFANISINTYGITGELTLKTTTTLHIGSNIIYSLPLIALIIVLVKRKIRSKK